MSNAERWDHSGYNELINEEKPNNYKKQIGNKKHFYKYKDNMGPSEKQSVSEYLDNSQMNNRKNQSKKFSNYNYNKYHNDEWNNDNEKGRELPNSELFESQSGSNCFKGKYKKKKKGEEDYQDTIGDNKSGINEYYNKNLKIEERTGNPNQSNPHYGSSNLNYGNVRTIEQITNNSNINNINSNSMNQNYYGRNKNNQPYPTINASQGVSNNISGNFSVQNSGFNNINPNFQSSNPKNIQMSNQPYQNFNNYMSSPYNLKVSGVPSNYNSSKPNSSNQIYHIHGNLNNASNNTINQSPSNSADSNTVCHKIVIEDRNYIHNDEELITHQNQIVKNDIYGSNSKKASKTNQVNNCTIENTELHNITRNSDEKNSLPNTPNRNSGKTYQSNTTTSTSMHINSQTPSNSVGFSPKNSNDPIYISNMIKMPNNYNFNSPIIQDNFIYPNYPNTRNPINMNNMNGPYYGMMSSMNTMNMNSIEPNTFQGIQNNFNPNMNTNFGTFQYNAPPHHMPMMPQMKGPIVNNINQNQMNINPPNIQHGNRNTPPVEMYKHNSNLNIHNEEIYNTDLRSSGKKSSNVNISNNNMQLTRGISTGVINNNAINPNNFNPFERSTAAGNVYNTNPNNKKGMQPYNNNFINNNININNLNYNQINMGNKNYNNRKMNNNFNPNMNNANQNPMQRMKYVKSDKNLMANLQNQNSFKMQQISQENPGENRENNLNPKTTNNKIWRDSKGNNSANIDTLTSIINNTIKISPQTNVPTNKNNGVTFPTFTSIREEEQHNENLNKNKTYSNFALKQSNSTNFDDKYFSSNDSQYSIAEEELKYEDKDILMYVSIRISGKDELLGINSKEDSQITIRKFITRNHLNEKLIKPISEKVKNALTSIDTVLQSKVKGKQFYSFNQIKKQCLPKINEEVDNLPDLDLSCFTEIGGYDTNCETFHLTNEEEKSTEKLNMSR